MKTSLLNSKACSGMTLMEVMIAMAVLSIGMLLTMQVLKTTGDDMYAETINSDIQRRSSGRVYEMIADLQNIVASDNSEVVLGLNLTQTNPLAAVTGDLAAGAAGIGNSIRFRVITGVDVNGAPVYSGKIRYRWLCSSRETAGNGLDDDYDGVADDGYIVREELDNANNIVNSMVVEDHIKATLSGVGRQPYGLTIERKATNMRQILLTVQRSANQRKATTDGNVATATVQRKIFLRNP